MKSEKTIEQNENELFAKWSKSKKSFIKDGIIDEDCWNESNRKIIFVLKEANDKSGNSWDLREFLFEGGRRQTWNNIARWVYGIRNLNKEIKWKEISKISYEFRKEQLQTICAINLKKVPGGHTTKNNELYVESHSDSDYLKKQFEIYSDVDLIICCGSIVSELFHDKVNDYPQYSWLETSRGIRYHQIGEHKFLFEYLHPEVRVGNFKNILFYGLIDAIKEAYSNQDK